MLPGRAGVEVERWFGLNVGCLRGKGPEPAEHYQSNSSTLRLDCGSERFDVRGR